MAQDVTNKIADAVEQLMDLDVEKVMLSTLPPIGCTPWLSRSSDYSTCGSQTVFKDEFNLDWQPCSSASPPVPVLSNRRSSSIIKLDPYCCEIYDQSGHCGQMEDGDAMYVLCPTPDKKYYYLGRHQPDACRLEGRRE
ncbi:uncharacterized protein [Miscanthus floridulus]|uniref:uncharacterized protein n=1 Tax=Miscanthus floridulus TaxID=154761 RepID=UPI00345A6EEB